MKLYIEELKFDSIYSHNLRFGWSGRELYVFRKANLKTTQMLWLKCRPCICSNSMTLYSPSCPILIILN